MTENISPISTLLYSRKVGQLMQVKPVVDTFKEHGVQTKRLNVIMYSSTVLCEILDIVLNMKDP